MLQPQDSEKPAQPGGCLKCHIGDGQLKDIFGDSVSDGTVTAAEIPDSAKEGIDCLLCHAGVDESVDKYGDYANRSQYDFGERHPVKVAADDPDAAKYPTGFKMQQDRSTATAQTVGRVPEFANCFYPCHGYSGGGYGNKKGVRFEPQVDVHAAAGMECVDCHEVEDHRFPAGQTSDINVNDDWSKDIGCATCHTAEPHANVLLDEHTDELDCRTCHITEYTGSITWRDWTAEPVLKDTGLYAPATKKNMDPLVPTYLWWDQESSVMTPQERQGEFRAHENGKIFAFKGAEFTIPWDEEHDQAVYAKRGKFLITGDDQLAWEVGMDLAFQKGLRESPWNGEYVPETEHVYYQVTHMVTADAWGCNDCHTAEGSVMDFELLGYSPEEIEELTIPR